MIKKILVGIFFFLVILWLPVLFLGTNNEVKPKELTRKEIIEKQFNPWDGSHIELVKLIKESMNDPDSYKHIDTIYWDKGDFIDVVCHFSGRNQFGGVAKHKVFAKVSLDNKILEINY